MKRNAVVFLLLASVIPVFAQASSGEGIQFSGTFSANAILDYRAGTVSMDNNAGNSFLQLDASYRESAYGFDSQLQFGPSPGTGVSNFLFKYGYAYAFMLKKAAYFALGRFNDLATFGLVSYYQSGGDGPGVYGSKETTAGSGFGVDGMEVRVNPVKDLVLGIVVPFPEVASNLLNASLGSTQAMVSYTWEKTLQVVGGYELHVTGVADMVTPPLATFTALNHNKLYALANLLVSDTLVAGARWELDHNVATLDVISNNGYLTLGGTFGDFSVGGDAGLYFPVEGKGGLELLGSSSYIFRSIGPGLDFQPYLSVSYFSSAYPAVYPEPSTSTSENMIFNPQLRLLLGKSQHQLTLGYTLTYDFAQKLVSLNQVNVMMQIYF
jgi:hypothetical protein